MKPLSVIHLVQLVQLVLLVSFSVLATACYGAAPPRPARLTLPPLSEDAQLVVHSQTRTTIERVPKESSTCPAGHAPGSQACTITRYEVAEPVTRTNTRATYNGEPITYGQFKVMTDPQYDTKLATLAELSHKCRRANVPRYAGVGLLLGGAAAFIFSSYSEALPIVGTAALIGGGASYAFGYFGFGGRQCNQARSLYREVDMTEERDWKSVQGAGYATEMQTLADQFNAMRGPPASALKMR